MAIQDEDTGGKFSAAIPTASAPTAAPQTATASKGWDFMALGALGGISRAASSEVLVKANAVVTETLASLPINTGYDVRVLKVDNVKETALRLSSLVIVVSRGNEKLLGYHTVLLEASSDAMPPRMESFNGQQIAIDRFAADVYDQRYAQAVQKLVGIGYAGFKGKECSAVVAPRTFNWEDKDAVRQLVNNALLACVAFLETQSPDFQDINLGNWNRASQLQAQVSFNENTASDYVGLPVRTDAAVVLSATSARGDDPTTLNNQERSQAIARVGGFFDLLWAPTPEATNVYGTLGAAPAPKFAMRFVMTQMENVMRMTPASQLLALASVLTLAEGTNWYPAFQPRSLGAGGNVVDTKDIGAINIEANVMNDPSGYGPKIDTKSASFNQLELGQLIQRSIRPGLSIALDVSSCGSDTWYNEPMAAASAGVQKAVEAILRAADTLTANNFRNHFKSGQNPVIQNDEVVLMGYYTGRDGTRHDIRDIDYLAVMNLVGESDPTAPQAWSDTFTRLDYPLIKRLDERKKMICKLVGTEVTFTQVAKRVTFTSEFLIAFANALRDVNLVIKPINPALHGEYINNRGNATWIAQSAMGVGATGLYQTGFSGLQQAAGQRHWGASAW